MNRKKLVIVGGVAGGMSAAARARRLSEESEIIVLERSHHVSYANCGLPYFIGGEIESEDKLLVATPDALAAKLRLDVRVRSEVLKIDASRRTVTVRDLDKDCLYEESYDDLLLSVGAAPLRPNIPGINLPGLFSLRNIEDTQAIHGWLEQAGVKTAVVAGGGFIGLEMAEQLVRRGLQVSLVESKKQVLAPLDPEMAELVHQELSKHGIKLVLGAPISAFQGPLEVANGIRQPQAAWVIAGDEPPIAADMVVLGLGVRPETKLAAEAGIELGGRGGIEVSDTLRTSVPNIWAVGDAIEVLHPIGKFKTLIALGGPANRQGRIVAENIFGAKRPYPGTLGTAIVRVFDLTAAVVGLSESQLFAAGFDFEVVYTHPAHHAGYYPGATRMDMKVMFEKNSGKLLGAQIVGRQGVDKRIDVIATAMKLGGTIEDLADLELAYAPPFGSAKDPVNLAGMVGSNVLSGLVSQIQWRELAAADADTVTVVDVRTLGERARGFIPGSLHIPLDQLRDGIRSIPRDKDVVVYCQSGQRSYMATRLLVQAGFRARNLAGGFLTWSTLNEPAWLAPQGAAT